MKDKIVIFGTGFHARRAYYKLKEKFQIIFFIDNAIDEKTHECLFDIPVISGKEFSKKKIEDIDVVICVLNHSDIVLQLIDIGLRDFYIMLDGFLYYSDIDCGKTMMPTELYSIIPHKKDRRRSVLFVQDVACIRTHKIATMMKENGWETCLLYTVKQPMDEEKEFFEIYDKIYTYTTLDSIRNFIEMSDFDVIHCSNEPDILVNIANSTSKPVIADTHDLLSIQGKNNDLASMAMEYLANVASDGNLYPSYSVMEIAKGKYNLGEKNCYVLENFVLRQEKNICFKKKISAIDNEIHCVYEGSIDLSHNAPKNFLPVWEKFAQSCVHIHFYSQSAEEICRKLEAISPYIHWEGNLKSRELITAMTQYDYGLDVFNINDYNRLNIEASSANKVFEYLSAQLPVLYNVKNHGRLLKKHGAGIEIDMNYNILSQLEKNGNIIIEQDFLEKNGLTMMSRKKDLERFYLDVITNKNRHSNAVQL